MQKVELQTRLNQIIDSLVNGKIEPEVVAFTDYKNKYINLKNEVFVEVRLTDGKQARLDVTNWFFNNKNCTGGK